MELWSAERVCIRGRFEKDWGVMTDDHGVIQAIGPRKQLVARAKSVSHYPGRILIPGFINPHHSGFHRIFRGLANFSAPFQEIREKLVWPLSQIIDGDLWEAVYRVAFAELLFNGITTVGEFFYMHHGAAKEPQPSHYAKRLIDIAVEMGLRINLVFAFFDQGASENTKAFIQPLDASLEEFRFLKEHYRNQPLVKILPGVHSLEHTSAEAILAAAELAREFDSPLHVLLADSPESLDRAKLHYGVSPLRALEKMEVLDGRVVVIHGTHLDEEELGMMKRHDMMAVVCPSASLARGSEFPNTFGLLREEVPFAVGSSTLGINNTYSVPDEIKLLEFTQRSVQKQMNVLSSQMRVSSLLELGTTLPAKALGLEASQLMPGTPADFMLVEVVEPIYQPDFNYASQHFMNQLLFGWGTQVKITHTIVQGKPVIANGMLAYDLGPSVRKLERWSELLLNFIKKVSQPVTA